MTTGGPTRGHAEFEVIAPTSNMHVDARPSHSNVRNVLDDTCTDTAAMSGSTVSRSSHTFPSIPVGAIIKNTARISASLQSGHRLKVHIGELKIPEVPRMKLPRDAGSGSVPVTAFPCWEKIGTFYEETKPDPYEDHEVGRYSRARSSWHSERKKRAREDAGTKESNKINRMHSLARALQHARFLAEDVNGPYEKGSDAIAPDKVNNFVPWPIVWHATGAYVYVHSRSWEHEDNVEIARYKWRPLELSLDDAVAWVKANGGKYGVTHFWASTKDGFDYQGLTKDLDFNFRCGEHPMKQQRTLIPIFGETVSAAQCRPAINVNWIHCPETPKFMIDSGSGVDVVCELSILEFLEYVYESDTPLSLLTANGVVEATRQINIWIPALKEMVSPYVLEETPDLLSMGMRVIVRGYSVSWTGFSEVMRVTKPDGKSN